MKNSIFFIIISFLLFSCKLVRIDSHKFDEEHQLKNIGFVRFENNTVFETVFPHADSIYSAVVFETFNKYIINKPKRLDTCILYENANLNNVFELCKENGIDGLLIARLKIKTKPEKTDTDPISQYFHTEIEIKLLDLKRNLIIQKDYITWFGKSFNSLPSEKRIIRRCTKIALNQIITVMKLKKK